MGHKLYSPAYGWTRPELFGVLENGLFVPRCASGFTAEDSRGHVMEEKFGVLHDVGAMLEGHRELAAVMKAISVSSEIALIYDVAASQQRSAG